MSGESLVEAVRDGKADRVREVLAMGVRPDAPDSGGSTALYVASVGGDLEIVGLLLSAGAAPDLLSLGDSDGLPLCGAACWGHEEVVEALLLAGANPNRKESGDWTPVKWAVVGGHIGVLTRLLAFGARPLQEGRQTSLWLAADRGAVDVVRMLLNAGADPRAVNESGETALDAALRWADVDVEAELRQQKSEVYSEPEWEITVIREEQDDETELITVEARRPGQGGGGLSEKQTGHGAIATVLERELGTRTPFETLVGRALEFRAARPTATEGRRDVTERPAWWESVRTLQERADTGTFEDAAKLAADPDPLRRRLGVDVLAQLGRGGDRPFATKSLPILRRMTRDETDPALLRSLILALSHHGDAAALPEVLKHSRHDDPAVRDAVAFALMSVLPPDDALGTGELIRMTGDEHEDVRDWATTSLSLLESDTPQIRTALAARVEDESLVVAAEAVRGLAERGDRRAVAGIHRLLTDPAVDNYPLDLALESAALLHDPSLRGPLEAVRELAELHGLTAEWTEAMQGLG
ncbi:ankyrin repeat domain-containing protein [Actinocorallia longicatena]|uniref:Ankyrin repeat protein n=1 Tax=Actinocorallia longicatena TaxID=111803 RepID=A0ABP6QCA8_9ACTN